MISMEVSLWTALAFKSIDAAIPKFGGLSGPLSFQHLLVSLPLPWETSETTAVDTPPRS